MITIQDIEGGYCVSVPLLRWTYWVYPDAREIRNNGERWHLQGMQVAPRLTLPRNWTLGDVIDAVLPLVAMPDKTNFGGAGKPAEGEG